MAVFIADDLGGKAYHFKLVPKKKEKASSFGCTKCGSGLEVLERVGQMPILSCPNCQKPTLKAAVLAEGRNFSAKKKTICPECYPQASVIHYHGAPPVLERCILHPKPALSEKPIQCIFCEVDKRRGAIKDGDRCIHGVISDEPKPDRFKEVDKIIENEWGGTATREFFKNLSRAIVKILEEKA
jgi:hypothetical protein